MLEAPGRVLPRPMSLCLAPAGELAFLIDPIGPGTRALCALEPGDELRCSARSATASASTSQRPLLVGGGIGIAPLPYLSEALGAPPAVLGFRSEQHAEAAALVPNAEVVIDPVLRHRGAARRPGDVLACGPEPMLEAVRALVPDAQLAWEAPMACGYGACYGCVVEIDGELKRLCVEGPVLCAAERERLPRRADRARGRAAARRVRDEDVTPEPREGNPPVRIAETDDGMLNSIGLANPGRERFLARDAAAAARARRAALGLGRRLRGARVRRDVRARSTDVDGDRAEPLVPERRRGAGVGGRDRRRLPRGDRPAALREALAGRLGHRRGRARGRGGRRRRALARQHDPRPRPRRAQLRPTLGARRPAATPGRR